MTLGFLSAATKQGVKVYERSRITKITFNRKNATAFLDGGAITTADFKAAGLMLAGTNTQAIRISVALPPTPRILAATRAGADGNSVVLQGTADAGSMVMVTRTDAGVVGATIARANGSWSFTCPAAAQGASRFTAAIENDAGIVSLDSAPLHVGG